MPMGSDSKKQAKAAQAELTVALQGFLDGVAKSRPKVSDKAAFDQLVSIVQDSTQKNERAAQFSDRVKAAGKAVATLATKFGLLV